MTVLDTLKIIRKHELDAIKLRIVLEQVPEVVDNFNHPAWVELREKHELIVNMLSALEEKEDVV